MALKNYLPNHAYAESFAEDKKNLPGSDLDWLEKSRTAALEKFTQQGFPGPNVEEWKYSNLNNLCRSTYGISVPGRAEAEITDLYEKAHLKGLDAVELVFVNGYYHEGLSTKAWPKNCEIRVFSQNPESFKPLLKQTNDQNSLHNLNQALMTDGLFVKVSAGQKVEKPLHVIHLITADMDQKAVRLFNQIIVEKNAALNMVETCLGVDQSDYWSHMRSDIKLGPDARLSHFQLQLQGNQAKHMCDIAADTAQGTYFQQLSLQLGAEMSRTEIHSSLTGEEARLDLGGASLARAGQSHDILTTTGHDMPHCQSDQLYRMVIDKDSKGAFQGKVIVAKDAQKTNANQSCKSLLLDRKAEANAKPELLIYADDVKCTHGATVGELDKDQLFYLKSRGLDERAAKSLLVEAFVAEVFDPLQDDALKQAFKDHVAGWLSQKEMKS